MVLKTSRPVAGSSLELNAHVDCAADKDVIDEESRLEDGERWEGQSGHCDLQLQFYRWSWCTFYYTLIRRWFQHRMWIYYTQDSWHNLTLTTMMNQENDIPHNVNEEDLHYKRLATSLIYSQKRIYKITSSFKWITICRIFHSRFIWVKVVEYSISSSSIPFILHHSIHVVSLSLSLTHYF